MYGETNLVDDCKAGVKMGVLCQQDVPFRQQGVLTSDTL